MGPGPWAMGPGPWGMKAPKPKQNTNINTDRSSGGVGGSPTLTVRIKLKQKKNGHRDNIFGVVRGGLTGKIHMLWTVIVTVMVTA